MVAVIALAHLGVRRSRAAEPWAGASVVLPVLIFLVVIGGFGAAAGWTGLALVVGVVARVVPRRGRGRPDAADLIAVLGWAAAFAVRPELLAIDRGGWLGPAVLLLAARHLGDLAAETTAVAEGIGAPTREIRGTVSLRGVVATAADLPATVPIDLDLRAGASLAVLCDEPAVAQSLVDVLAGQTRPFAGELVFDGAPSDADDRLVAVVATGEPFVEGDLDTNIGALRDDRPDRSTLAAARDACGLAEVVEFLGTRAIAPDGDPLGPFHRLLVQTARVLVSHYRVLVVADPGPWVDARRSELWRAAVVRASVGRTAIWITDDPELADRADHVHELVGGSLREMPSD
jgi:ABC-type protease/lipase transport system fused ATPase/permease subunit